MTVVVLIGNSDDRLTQSEWHEFQLDLRRVAERFGDRIHFVGHSYPNEPWQTVAIVVEMASDWLSDLEQSLLRLKERYRQDSIAMVVNPTQFV